MSVTHSVVNSALAIGHPGSGAVPASACARPSRDDTSHGSRDAGALDPQRIDKADHIACEQIRKGIVADKGLSLYAHSVKIIAAAGEVILKGTVKSEEEKRKIVSNVTSVVAAEKVVDELTVRSKQAFMEIRDALFQAVKERPHVHHEHSSLRSLRDTGDRKGGRRTPAYTRLH